MPDESMNVDYQGLDQVGSESELFSKGKKRARRDPEES
jgi:hypothetical protein